MIFYEKIKKTTILAGSCFVCRITGPNLFYHDIKLGLNKKWFVVDQVSSGSLGIRVRIKNTSDKPRKVTGKIYYYAP